MSRDILARLDLDHEQFNGRSSVFGDAAAEIRALRATVARVKALADEWERLAPGSALDILTAADLAESEACGWRDGMRTATRLLRAALGGDGGGMGPVDALEGPESDELGSGRVVGHLGERQDGSGR